MTFDRMQLAMIQDALQEKATFLQGEIHNRARFGLESPNLRNELFQVAVLRNSIQDHLLRG